MPASRSSPSHTAWQEDLAERVRRASWLAETTRRIQDEKDAAAEALYDVTEEAEEAEEAEGSETSGDGAGGEADSSHATLAVSASGSRASSRPSSSRPASTNRAALASARRVTERRRMSATQRRSNLSSEEPVSDNLFALRRPASARALADKLMGSTRGDGASSEAEAGSATGGRSAARPRTAPAFERLSDRGTGNWSRHMVNLPHRPLKDKVYLSLPYHDLGTVTVPPKPKLSKRGY